MKQVLAGFFVFVVLSLMAGCTRGRVIPVKTFSKITQDMLMADAWLDAHPECRTKADTSLLYDPIFKKYGYRFRDYDTSVNYYMAHPEKYRQALDMAQERLQASIKVLDTMTVDNSKEGLLEEQIIELE